MAFFAWLLIGSVCATALHRLSEREASMQFLDLVLGMVGSFWTGLAACVAMDCDFGTFATATMPAAAAGAVATVQIYHWLRRRRQ